MKKLLLFGLLFAAWAQAQVSYEVLKADIHGGTAPEEIKNNIREKGLAFQIDIVLLRTMKADRMPDWLIDFLIEYNPSDLVSRPDAPRRYAGDDYYYQWDQSAYWSFSPWSYAGWYYYWSNPWIYTNYFGYYAYAGFGLGWPHYYGSSYIHNYRHSSRSHATNTHSRGGHATRGSHSDRAHARASHSDRSHAKASHSRGSQARASHSRRSHTSRARSRGSHSRGSHSRGSHSRGSHSRGSHSRGH